jgi:hypothetical protein
MRLINKHGASGSTNAGMMSRGKAGLDLLSPRAIGQPPATKAHTAQPRMSKAGATSSPSNTIKTMHDHSAPTRRSSGPIPKGFVSRTPKPRG